MTPTDALQHPWLKDKPEPTLSAVSCAGQPVLAEASVTSSTVKDMPTDHYTMSACYCSDEDDQEDSNNHEPAYVSKVATTMTKSASDKIMSKKTLTLVNNANKLKQNQM